jgi:environmental stress-induced protein Ves
MIRKASTLTTSRWSGGTTTELFIWPETATYAARDFGIRISTATVELPVSEFTPLPGIDRTLMVLEGTLKLEFATGDSPTEIELEPLEIAHFSGGLPTTGYGQVRDFNVMCANGFFAETVSEDLEDDAFLAIERKALVTVIYILEGALRSEDLRCEKQDVLIINEKDSGEWQAVGKTLLARVSCFQQRS